MRDRVIKIFQAAGVPEDETSMQMLDEIVGAHNEILGELKKASKVGEGVLPEEMNDKNPRAYEHKHNFNYKFDLGFNACRQEVKLRLLKNRMSAEEIKKILETFLEVEWVMTNDKDDTDEKIEKRLNDCAEKIHGEMNKRLGL